MKKYLLLPGNQILIKYDPPQKIQPGQTTIESKEIMKKCFRLPPYIILTKQNYLGRFDITTNETLIEQLDLRLDNYEKFIQDKYYFVPSNKERWKTKRFSAFNISNRNIRYMVKNNKELYLYFTEIVYKKYNAVKNAKGTVLSVKMTRSSTGIGIMSEEEKVAIKDEYQRFAKYLTEEDILYLQMKN